MVPHRIRTLLPLAIFAAASWASPSTLGAQRVTTEMGGSARELGGHRFIPTGALRDPFLASRFSSSISFGGARDLEVPIYNAQDSLVNVLTGDLGFLAIDFEYQQQITGWLALRGGAGGVARLGTDQFSFAAEGVSTIYGFNLGASGRLWGTERLQLTAMVDYSSSALYGVQPLTYLQGVTGEVRRAVDSLLAAGGVIDSATIDSVLRTIDLSKYNVVSSGSAQRTNVGLGVAWAAAPWLGFTVATQSGLGNLIDGNTDLGIVDVGASASIDLGVLWTVPLGIAVTGRFQNFNERSSDIAGDITTFSTFVSYAARRDLALGLEVTNASLGQPTGGTIRVSRAALAMTYFF